MPAVETTKSMTGKDYFLWFVRLLKGLAIISLLFTMASYIIVIKVACDPDSQMRNLDKAFLTISAIGFILLAIMLIIAEFEPKWFIEKAYVLHFWAGRGIWIGWIGVQNINSVQTLADATAAGTNGGSGTSTFMKTFGYVVGWVMISIGCVYILMSVLCVRACMPESTKEELEVNLMSDQGSSSSTTTVVNVSGGGGGGSSAADAQLIANLSTALGISADDAKKRFAGSAGAKEAEKVMKDRAAQLKSAAASSASGTYVAPTAASSSGASSSSAPAPAQSSFSAAATPSESRGAFDDDGPRRKRLDDDEELERQYYASRVKQ